VAAVARHEGIARQAVFELKYRHHFDIATVLGPLMAGRVSDKPATLVPVPLHWRRKRARGYNQSELLAFNLGRTLGWPVDSSGLRRLTNTKDQLALDASLRQANVAGAFRWRNESVPDRVLLVDDVFTTGATLNACAGAIRAAGGREVDGVVFAAAPRIGADRGPMAIS